MADVKDIIQKLNSIDMATVDYKQIQEDLLQRKDLLINIAIVLVSAFVFFNILGNRNRDVAQYQQDIQNLEAKVEFVEQIETVAVNKRKFFSAVPTGPTDVSGLISVLNQLAIDNNVRILSFTPSGEESNEFFSRINLTLNVAAQNFTDMGHFVYTIETANKNLRIDAWSAGTVQDQFRSRWQPSEPQTDDEFKATLHISVVNINKD